MSFTLDINLALGLGKTGLTDLRAQLVDTTGTSVGTAVSTGFVEIGVSGNYLWHYAAFPDAHRGGVKFYSNAAPTVFLAFVAINPEEVGGLLDGAITDAKITAPNETAGRPTTILAMLRRIWEWSSNKRTRDRSDGTVNLRNAADSGTLETQTQSTSGTTDSQTKGV